MGFLTSLPGRIVIAVAVLIVYAAASDNVLPLTATLRQEVTADSDGYRVSLFRDGETAAAAAILVTDQHELDGLYRITVRITHDDESVLDSLTLDFHGVRPESALLLETPDGLERGVVSFRRAPDDAGAPGGGVVALNFFIRLGELATMPDEPLSLDVSLALRGTGAVKLTRHLAETTVPLRHPVLGGLPLVSPVC
jgi:hypothetical protein